MMHGKIIWKHGIGAIAKASRGIAPETHKVRGAHMNPQLQWQYRAYKLLHIGFAY